MKESTIININHFLRHFNIIDLAIQSEDNYFFKQEFNVKGKINIALTRPKRLDKETCEQIATFQVEFSDLENENNTYIIVSIEHQIEIKFDVNELDENKLYDKNANANDEYHRAFGDFVIEKVWSQTKDLANLVLASTRYEDVALPDKLNRNANTDHQESQ
ncbi:hypothetical protein [Exiguobacterium sp. K1]|uniref:hypothetical protein n=1 Tax=Exiguobacterium sp. K1 TaxID=2980105 RepID=UPI00299DB468|nr:hypothetical protein [Exiguobacterium sp. K1]MDX1260717.1 hypothetical protein [Exiguobacterium sp. K1]